MPCTITAAIITAGDRTGRDAERHHRHESAGRRRIVGRLGTGDAFDRALAEALGMLREAPLQAVGNERRNDVRRARNDADQKTEQAAARDRARRVTQVLRRRHELPQCRLLHFRPFGLAGGEQDLGNAEEPDRDRHDADAVAELDEVEAEARVAAHRIDADHAEHQAERRHRERLQHRAAAHVGEYEKTHEEQRGVFRRTEAQRESGERRREQHEADDAERARDERADRRDRERRSRAAFLRHRVAVDARHHRGGLARYAHEDRRRGAAVHRAVIDPAQQHHRDDRVQPERRGKQQADAGERPEPRHHAHERADHAARKRVDQYLRLERDRKPEHEVVEGVDHQKPHGPAGSGTRSSVPMK